MREALVEYHGQIVGVMILRSFWRWHRVQVPVVGGHYRLAWVPRRKVLS